MLEVDHLVVKKDLGNIVDRCYRRHGPTTTSEVLDRIKKLGFTYSTKGGVTVGFQDIVVPKEKKELISAAESKVVDIDNLFRQGMLSNAERRERVIKIWEDTTEQVSKALMGSLDPLNPIYMMANSGARGSTAQIRQLAGMRGLMADPSGQIIEVPIRANFREGNKLIEPLKSRVIGRYAVEPVVHPETGEVLVNAGDLISFEQSEAIEKAGVKSVTCRSVFTCRAEHGICAKCYGANLATGTPVNIGEAVGIIAAQAIGEPGTQLTMRTFHTGGVASADDITQGRPRVEELFEARKPKGLAVISEIAGTVHIDDSKKRREAIVSNADGEAESYLIPFGSKLKVAEGQTVEAGDELTEGSVNPHDILKIKGVKGVQAYLLKEVQSVYRLQGVEISDKHIEVIIRQMLRKVQIEDNGDTNLLPGELIDIFRFEAENERVVEADGRPAIAKRKLLGITKAALATDSFLSAASFQETTRVLTEAAIKGKIDPLVGLKENVIIGKLIPAGIGLKRYKNVAVRERVNEG